MAVVLNPYSQQKSQLGVIEAGLKTLKRDKNLLGDNEFSAMYHAVEKHHRELRLAHLTGKAKDVMEQAARDTKFYNILIKMLCEIKKLPSNKQKETLKKVHNWYVGNRHTLATGPKFGKENRQYDDDTDTRGGFMQSKTPTNKTPRRIHSKSATSFSSYRSRKLNVWNAVSCKNDQEDCVHNPASGAKDNYSDIHGGDESVVPPSEPASSRLSTTFGGNDFLTDRFMMELPSSKLSWNLESPLRKSPFDIPQFVTDWDGADFDNVRESSLSQGTLDDPFQADHQSAPNSSPQSARSGGSGDSSGPDVGSVDMMDFQSDARRRLSRGLTSSGGPGLEFSDNQSTETFGLQKRMVHSIASLVNPHAKLAENEAIRQEREYIREQTSAMSLRGQISRAQSSMSGKRQMTDLSAHIPVLRAVSVASNKGDNLTAFNNFKNDHLYGQDILSKLKFVGRSGTALDVRYSAHAQAEEPERHTKEVIHLYNMLSNTPKTSVGDYESQIHTQSLEDFYQSAENYYPTHLPKYGARILMMSAPTSRMKGPVKQQGPKGGDRGGVKTAAPRENKNHAKQSDKKSAGKATAVDVSHKQGRSPRSQDGDEEDEILYTAEPSETQVKLNTVVGLIDHVKDEMNFFKEKLAPVPMAGFRQPASTSVSSKPLSRPGSTASKASRPKSSVVRPPPRSPSPQGRPGTPMETDEILMGEAEVPADLYSRVQLPNRPHSATVNRAVDWRGKVTPEAAKIRSKMRFGGHSYVQKMKPSLRTAGSQSAGKRPKTAPISVKEKWNTKEKECDKNERVPQAASNTMTQVDDRDMDRIMSIQHLMGSSDSSYGSMGSLFLDEDFLRSFNSRYALRSSLSHVTTDSQNREFLSFVAPTPRIVVPDSRPGTRAGARRADVKKIPEEEPVSEGSETDTASPTIPPLQLEQTDEDQIAEANLVQTSTCQLEVTVSDQEAVTFTQTESSRSEVNKGLSSATREEVVAREIVHVATEDREDDVHIEVTALPASRPPHPPPTDVNDSLQKLTTSEEWHFKSEPEKKLETSSYLSGTQDVDFNRKQTKPVKSVIEKRRPYSAFESRTLGLSLSMAGTIVKPDTYCFNCIPDESMNTKVGRSAGRMPGGTQTPAGQVLRMARRQNELYKKAPPVRTPPSIPSSQHLITRPSPRQGQQYSTELEHHARKVNSPRHFMEQDVPRRPSSETSGRILRGSPFVELRKDSCRSAPATGHLAADDIMGSLSVISLRAPGRAHTAPSLQDRKQETLEPLATHPEESQCDDTETNTPASSAPGSGTRAAARVKPVTGPGNTSLAHIGRPIPQVSHVPDPEEESEAVLRQKEAKAAVDIQRIFRGFVCRNSYRQLLWENRREAEDKRMALLESQRQYRKHQGRKAAIYNRPPLDPALLQWAHDFKAVQLEKAGRRQEKMNSLAEEMLANQQKAKSKIEVIGPHVEIYDIYHPKEVGPSKRDMHKASICIQKYIRGFLVRRRFEKLHRKATFVGSTWERMVRDYKTMLVRVQRWHGVDKPTTPFVVDHMHEYMDSRRRFESQFDKKAFNSELELSELQAFFKECDLYPSAAEIEEGLDVITQGQALRKGGGLCKADTLSLVFYIYVPPGTGLSGTRQSTWMNPIINGQEARKLIDHALKQENRAGSEFVEGSPLKPCADMVMRSRRERREAEEVEKERLRLLEKHELVGTSDSDSDEPMKHKVSTSVAKHKKK
ncbi:uncharacterized protein LOC127879720 isoform X3 [Dreissena polymorpha]|uniref:uncharacterized protein LOC127879720 isoform X3 n=1 Tax=Dreissena polymorpha TaxID=45954 RepID=UPI0022652547|nr:uncharacterized protein LOC127879720 isoform X3 [Dreissena polymorpha]